MLQPGEESGLGPRVGRDRTNDPSRIWQQESSPPGKFDAESTSIRDYDWWLLATAFAICGVGVLEIWSATHASHLVGMHTHQLEWIALGFVLMLLLSRLDYHLIMDQAPVLYLDRDYCADCRAGIGPCAIRSQAVAAHPGRAFCRCRNWSS
jgi:hypothetical protein